MDIFDALGDPTRRAIAEAVAARGPMTATQLARDLPISRQATAKHLQQLRSVGLVTDTRVGRETRFGFRTEALTEVQSWVERTSTSWAGRLERLRDDVESRP